MFMHRVYLRENGLVMFNAQGLAERQCVGNVYAQSLAEREWVGDV
jgi:hypothetical protein